MLLFCVFDSKVNEFMTPFFSPSVGAAKRSFSRASIEDPNFKMFGGDYTLFQIGSWAPVDAALKQLEHKVNLGTALEHQAGMEVER